MTTTYNLKKLGKISNYQYNEPSANILEMVENPHKDRNYVIKFTCPEFTSICPVTHQPDFAYLIIDYVPNEYIIESKSLKLYFFSYRNHPAFHEDCTISIAKDLELKLSPRWLRIGGYWYPRGGMPIDIFYQNKPPLKDLFLPDHNISNYKGRV